MAIWVVIGLVLLLALLSWADARDKVNLPKRSWNIWVGPKPRDGESEARYSLRRALAAGVTLLILAIPLLFVSSPPDEGSNFSGDESMLGMAVFVVFGPLAAMTFVALWATLFSALVSALFRRSYRFDSTAGKFTRR